MFPRILLSVIIILALTGCATTKKTATGSGVEELQTKVSDLERQLQEKDDEVRDLEERLSKVKMFDSEEIVNAQEVDISKVTPKRIQITLKNAGFYSGTIDGKIGKKTREAIKEFQKANGLKADGIVGKQTWYRLQKYLE
ncbi:MAG: peptidoglycan-binding protein [Candidatus Omnitrophica bacterium]|jgi:murein L,D-transpeptidase YcbB/YkuD|nr:peptidoglycan-binding protein [Candidatus Omnitrophota bacterium]